MEWDVDPPEPVVRGLRSVTTVSWQGAVGRRAARRVDWSSSAALVPQYRMPWQGLPQLKRVVSLDWGGAHLRRSVLGLRWIQSMAGTRMGAAVRWGALPVERSASQLVWRGQAVARQGTRVHWDGAPQRQRDHCRLNWYGELRRTHYDSNVRWGNPGLDRWDLRLPWAPARRTPWLVRTPKPIPPDPDPDDGFPDGAFLPLVLGCPVIPVAGLVPLNLGVAACYMVRPQRRTYVVINTVALVRLPDRMPIEVTRISLGASRGTWGWTFDIELADPQQLALLKPTAAGPRQFEVNLNGYIWTGIIESFQKQREFNGGGVRLSGRSRTALLAAPYAPARVKATTEERSMAQLVAEELADTGFTSTYDTVDWNVPAGAWFYDASTPLDAISALAEASGGVVQSDPAALAMRVRAAYPASPWDWRTTQPDHVLQEDIVLTESLQMRSAPLYDAVVVTGELAGKGVTCKVRKSGEEGRLYAQQVSSPLITVPAAGAERGRNILCDRGEQAAVDLTVPLFAKPLKAGEVGLLLPLDLVEVVGADGTWHGQCESLRIEVSADDRAVVIEQTATLERHYTDAD
ncbi:hypothetical protein SMRA8_1807 [Stenotrophomonas maltophilia RA8]|nr:hypothetical protein SMRA8_1807 [Stenotrophomonas maltophilia RA8]